MYKTRFALVVVLGFVMQSSSGARELTGVVQDGLDGKAVAGARVTFKGTRLGTVTDKAGIWSTVAREHQQLVRGNQAFAPTTIRDRGSFMTRYLHTAVTAVQGWAGLSLLTSDHSTR